ncbi:hypothetical protein [Treponema vincentii]|uniref:hypothetical protein n=1 Tax=Treponema vincentii TaxID=69710 RepID=UPI0020A5CC7D|nr:hypothetical protein [Treponema vincentii]UTC48249.1 hypothetical protein E4N73_05115 [Treponema vincentii]
MCITQISLLLIITDIPVRSETARSAQKTPAGTVNNAHPCTLFTCAICISQIAFLHGTRGIRAASDTSRIVSSGKDAAGLNRSDVSASAETRHQKCTRMYTFDDATTQMYRIFANVN